MLIKSIARAVCALAFLYSDFGSFAFAYSKERCQDVRLDQNGGPFEKIPIYNQMKFSKQPDPNQRPVQFGAKDLSASGENLCYAVVASQLIDAHRFAKGDTLSRLSSPISLALNHKTRFKKIPDEELDGTGIDKDADDDQVIGPGSATLALIANSDQPMCDQRWLDQYASLIAGNEDAEFPDDPKGRSVKSFFTATFQQIDQASSLKKSLSKREADLNEYFKCRTDAGVSNMKDILKASKAALVANDTIPKAQIFLRELCKARSFSVQIPKPIYYQGVDHVLDKPLNDKASDGEGGFKMDVLKQIHENRNERMRAKVSSLLRGPNPKPIGVGYEHGILEQGQTSGWSNHTSVIIGQRWNGKTCEFLLRDSYGGTNCAGARFPCDNGSFWIPERDLIGGSTSSIYWLP